MKLFNGRSRDVLLILLYKFSFDLVYVYNISEVFAYRGCTLDYEVGKYLLLTCVFLLLIIPTISLYYSSKASSLAVLLLTYLYFIPGLSLISFTDVGIGFALFYITYWVLILFWNSKMKNIKLPRLRKYQSGILFNIFVIFSIFTVLILSGIYTGFRLHFNIFDVYTLRAEERHMDFPKIVQYIQPMVAAIIPSLIIFFLIKKNKIMITLFVLLQLLLFGIGGHKSYLFALFVAVFIYLFYNKKRLVYIPLCFVFFNSIALAEGYFNYGRSIMASFIQYRVQIVPNLISYHMHDFMQNHEFLYLRESIFRFFGFESPYKPNYFFVIGETYFGDKFIQSNTGMCGDAYSQFGYLSLLIYPLFIPLSFTILGSICKNLSDKIVFVVVFLYISTFINGSFFSVLLTNGFLMVCFVLFLLSNKAGDFKNMFNE